MSSIIDFIGSIIYAIAKIWSKLFDAFIDLLTLILGNDSHAVNLTIILIPTHLILLVWLIIRAIIKEKKRQIYIFSFILLFQIVMFIYALKYAFVK